MYFQVAFYGVKTLKFCHNIPNVVMEVIKGSHMIFNALTSAGPERQGL